MSLNVNKVFLAGNATRDGELSYLPNGTPVLNWGMATNESYQDSSGHDVNKPVFVDCALFGKRGEGVAKYILKGKPLFLEGKLRYDTWEKNGERRSKLTMTVFNVEFVPDGQKRQDGGEGQARPEHIEHPGPGGQTFVTAPPVNNRVAPAGPLAEDDIPF